MKKIRDIRNSLPFNREKSNQKIASAIDSMNVEDVDNYSKPILSKNVDDEKEIRKECHDLQNGNLCISIDDVMRKGKISSILLDDGEECNSLLNDIDDNFENDLDYKDTDSTEIGHARKEDSYTDSTKDNITPSNSLQQKEQKEQRKEEQEKNQDAVTEKDVTRDVKIFSCFFLS